MGWERKTNLSLRRRERIPPSLTLISDILGSGARAELLGDLGPVVRHVEEERGQSALGRVRVRRSPLALLLVTVSAGTGRAMTQESMLVERMGDPAGELG